VTRPIECLRSFKGIAGLLLRHAVVLAILPFYAATSFAQLDHFKVEKVGTGVIARQRAGVPFAIRITAQRSNNATYTSFTGKVKITSTGLVTAGGDSTARFTAGVLASHTIIIGNTGTFTITATNVATGTSASFTVGAFMSDDFNARNINKRIWTISDPLGDAVFTTAGTGTSDARLAMLLPAGVTHDLYTGKNTVPRLMQPSSNVDFTLEVKYDSPLSQGYQIQGVLVQETENSLLRFDLSSDGTATKAYAASTSDGFATPPVTQIPLSTVAANNVAPLYMRVNRTGDTWTMYTSINGTSYSQVGSFSYTLDVTQAGLFAGNGGPTVPLHNALVDYFVEKAAPLSTEDGATVVDSLPPLLYDLTSIAGGTAIKVTWKTDERATTRLDYGKTPSFGTSVTDNTPQNIHTVLLKSLSTNTRYYIRIISTDSLSKRDTSATLQDTTYAKSPTSISLWYGNALTFGKLGTPQRCVNILGNVSDPVGLDSLYYRLNGGPPVQLSWGPNGRRLQNQGDFNIDIGYDALLAGPNTVALTAKNPFGESASTTITVRDSSGTVWPLPHTVTWSSAKSMTDSVQITDGKWALSSGKLRLVERGYDRILAFGDTTWTDYVMTAKLSVSGFDSSVLAYNSPSNGPSIAFLMRWAGHTTYPVATPQPLEGYLPLGAYASLSWPTVNTQRWEIFGDGFVLKEAKTLPELQFDTTYYFKMQVTTFAGQGGFYRFKFWKASQSEPAEWFLSTQEAMNGLQNGSALIVAHHVTATINDVVFSPIPYDNVPPNISGIQAVTSGTSSYFTLATDEPAFVKVEYGITSAYSATAIADSNLRLMHGIPITGLAPNTTYHYRITAFDNTGNSTGTMDGTFTTLPPPAGTTLVTDEFDATTLHARWTPFNPLGDATFSTPDTVLIINVPGGIPHEIWTDGYKAPRILQAANNTDVQVEAKWNTEIFGSITEYRTQGIIAEQDASNLIRFDFTSAPAGAYIFSASFVNGFTTDAITIRTYKAAAGATRQKPLFMRVAREGNIWSQWYSTTGTSWTLATKFYHPFTLTGMGLFASNAGSGAPALIDTVDYFRVKSPTVDVDNAPEVPAAFALEQNYPNPFNPSTTIRYALPRATRVSLEVFNVLGQQIADLVNEDQVAGFYSLQFNGLHLASGIYFYRLTAGGFVATKQLLLLK
jgi:hypothetical protein